MFTPRGPAAGGWAGVFLIFFFLASGCGDGGTGNDDAQTGATLQGQVVMMGLADSAEREFRPSGVSGLSLQTYFAPTSDVKVTVQGKSTKTDGSGSFILHDIPLGDQAVVFSGSGITGSYNLNDISQGSTYTLNEVQVSNGTVKTEHTGTWIGTAGSSEPGSQGQIAFTLVIAANGNTLSGTARVEEQDTTHWSMSGTETGKTVDGEMTLVSTNSPCATGASFNGTFSADTLSGSFVEVNPPTGCGSPESGTFRVVKQQS